MFVGTHDSIFARTRPSKSFILSILFKSELDWTILAGMKQRKTMFLILIEEKKSLQEGKINGRSPTGPLCTTLIVELSREIHKN